MMTKTKAINELISKPWYEHKNPICLLTRIGIKRNLKTHDFPHKLENSFKKELTNMLKNPLMECSKLKNAECFLAKDLAPIDKQFLYEYFLPLKDFSSIRDGEGFIFDQSGKLFFTLNLEDHIELFYLDGEGNLEEGWNTLLNIENYISKQIEFAFDQQFGFLTADFKKCGTALFIQNYLHLPLLIHYNLLEDHLLKFNRNLVDITSLMGSLENITGDIVILSNRQTLGMDEETLIKTIRTYTLKLQLAEKKLRQKAKESQDSLLIDVISKKFGALKHSVILDAKEALNSLSMVKLGLDIELFEGMDMTEFNQLFFGIRKGHIAKKHPKIKEDEINKKRAEYIQCAIKKLKLKK